MTAEEIKKEEEGTEEDTEGIEEEDTEEEGDK